MANGIVNEPEKDNLMTQPIVSRFAPGEPAPAATPTAATSTGMFGSTADKQIDSGFQMGGLTGFTGLDVTTQKGIQNKLESLFGKTNDFDSSLGIEQGKITGDLSAYDPTKQGSQTKSAFFDALNLQGQAAHGVDQLSNQVTAQATMQQAMTQGASLQSMQQQMAQAGMTPEQIAVQIAAIQRSQESEQTQLLSALVSDRLDRRDQAVQVLANMALSGRAMEQQEEQMALQDKWNTISQQLQEKGIDINAAYQEKAMELSNQGYDLQVVQTMLEQEFGKSGQALNWAKLALEDKTLAAQFNLSEEELEQKAAQIDSMIKAQDAQTFAQNVENYKETLKFVDTTTSQGMEQAKQLFMGMMNFSDPNEAEQWWSSFSFTDVQNAEFDSKKNDSIINAAEVMTSLGSDFFTDTAGFSLFNADGSFKDPASGREALKSYYYALGGNIPGTDKNYESVDAFVEDFDNNPAWSESFQNWANGTFDEYVLSPSQIAFKEATATLQDMNASGFFDSQEEFLEAQEGLQQLAYLDLTGGVVFDVDESGELFIKDTNGNVLFDPYGTGTGTQTISSSGFMNVGGDDATSFIMKDTDGSFILSGDKSLDNLGNPTAGEYQKLSQNDDGKWIVETVKNGQVVGEAQPASSLKEWRWLINNTEIGGVSEQFKSDVSQSGDLGTTTGDSGTTTGFDFVGSSVGEVSSFLEKGEFAGDDIESFNTYLKDSGIELFTNESTKNSTFNAMQNSPEIFKSVFDYAPNTGQTFDLESDADGGSINLVGGNSDTGIIKIDNGPNGQALLRVTENVDTGDDNRDSHYVVMEGYTSDGRPISMKVNVKGKPGSKHGVTLSGSIDGKNYSHDMGEWGDDMSLDMDKIFSLLSMPTTFSSGKKQVVKG